MKELRLGSITLDNPFFLAPLAGITDATMRKLCKEMGAALVFSEMVSAKGMWYGDKNTGRLLYTRKEEAPFGVQTVSYTHLRAHETGRNLVCRLLLEKKKTQKK